MENAFVELRNGQKTPAVGAILSPQVKVAGDVLTVPAGKRRHHVAAHRFKYGGIEQGRRQRPRANRHFKSSCLVDLTVGGMPEADIFVDMLSYRVPLLGKRW